MLEFLFITDSKLKIILDEADVGKYSLGALMLGKDGASSRKGFWRLLEQAKAACGFDPLGDKVLIQFYPMKNGGCEIFVTKLGILSESSARLVTRSEHVTTLSKRTSFYAFHTLKDLVLASRAVHMRGDAEDTASDAYISDSGGYYLSLIEYGHGDDGGTPPAFEEFARRLTFDEALRVSEHCEKIVSGDAIGFFAYAFSDFYEKR